MGIRRLACTVCLFLGGLLLVMSPVQASEQTSIPSVRSLLPEAERSANLFHDRQFIYLHEPREIQTSDGTRTVRFVSSMAVIDAPLDEVHQNVLDFSEHDDFIQQFDSVELLDPEDEFRVRYGVTMDMGLFSPYIEYELDYDLLENGDLTWEESDGDYRVNRGRWEFIEVDENRTLLVMTSWADFYGLDWKLNIVLSNQPEIQDSMVVTRTASIVQSFREQISGPIEEGDDDFDRDSPTTPLLTADDRDYTVLEPLLEQGTVMVIHPDQKYQSNGEDIRLTYTTTMTEIKGPPEVAREWTTKFEEYPLFIPPVSNAKKRTTEEGIEVDWTISLGLGWVSIPIHYTTSYRPDGDQRLLFESTSGDLSEVYGALEWEGLGGDETLFYYTTATYVGDQAPMVVRTARMIPDLQVFLGVGTGAVGIDRVTNWINEELQSE